MGKITVLGSGSAVPGLLQDNTHLLIQQGRRVVLVDCASNPVVRLQQMGEDPLKVTDLILTHFHPDHVSGLGLFLISMWLMGRKDGLEIYGLDYTLERAKAMLELYQWRDWPGLFPIGWHVADETEGGLVLEDADLRITSSPVKHLIPTIGLRVEFHPQQTVWAYSCDGEASAQTEHLAQGADWLFHEATGTGVGHSTAEEAGQVARKAGAAMLYLIHYHAVNEAEKKSLLQRAQSTFGGSVALAEDGLVLEV